MVRVSARDAIIRVRLLDEITRELAEVRGSVAQLERLIEERIRLGEVGSPERWAELAQTATLR